MSFSKKGFLGIIIILFIVIAAILVLFKGEDERSIVFFSGAGMKIPISEIVMVHVPEGHGIIIVPFEKEYEIKDFIMLAILKMSRSPEISKKFYDYFRTEDIKAFKRHGYNTEVQE